MLYSRTSIARSASEMQQVAPVWRQLLAHQPHTIFQRFSWNQLAAHSFAERITPYVVCVQADAGAAIIPAAINHASSRLELLGESLFDYRDVLHSGDPEILRAAWQQLAELGMPLRVQAVEGSGTTERWADFPRVPFATAPRVMRGSFAEQQFRSAHPRLARQLRRLHKQGVNLHVYSGHDSERIRRLYQAKAEQFACDPNNVFHDGLRREFMVSVAATEGNRCQVFALEINARALVAGLVTFVDQNVRRFYTTYFDPEWAHYSPGVALLYEITARSLGEGLGCDYMTGEYPYKLRLASTSHPLYQIRVSAGELADIASRRLASKVA